MILSINITPKGIVELFSSQLRSLLHTLHGQQVGAYFGASVLALDLNADGRSDIVVGSPMFRATAETYDTGRVDIYLREGSSSSSSNPNEFSFRHISLMGAQARSRFGSTLARLGDLNDDGYQDLAVSAPYEDQGAGCVYIYHGTAEGVRRAPAQILRGSTYGVQAFGYSLAGGLDLDRNQYPDLVVGAHKSDAVVYLRARSVIKTQMQAQTQPRAIDFESRPSAAESASLCGGGGDKNRTRVCLEMEYCIEYSGKAVPTLMSKSGLFIFF